MSRNVKEAMSNKCQENPVKQMSKEPCQAKQYQSASFFGRQTISKSFFLRLLAELQTQLTLALHRLRNIDGDMVPSGTGCIQDSSC